MLSSPRYELLSGKFSAKSDEVASGQRGKHADFYRIYVIFPIFSTCTRPQLFYSNEDLLERAMLSSPRYELLSGKFSVKSDEVASGQRGKHADFTKKLYFYNDLKKFDLDQQELGT